MNSLRLQTSESPTNKKDVAIMLAVLTALGLALEPKNPQDPTGQTGFNIRGTNGLVAREAAKLQPKPVKSNFGQDAGY